MTDPPTAPPPAPKLDPALVQQFMDRIRGEQNLPLAIIAGGVTALVTGGLWAWVTVLSGYTTGIGAILVGIAVGFSVRAAGKGLDTVYGVIGGVWALLACAGGNLLSVVGFVAKEEGVALTESLSWILGEVGVVEAMTATFSPMDLLFYGIAIYEGYKFAFRRIGPEELQGLTRG